MKKFLHIGYPKCFSTTLQRDFFSTHPELFYGGIGINSNIDFLNDELNILFESGLIYFREHRFHANIKRFEKALYDFYGEAAKNKAVRNAGFSSEHLLFNFTPQTIDIHVKLKRIKKLFGNDVQIIVILREQFSLIKSLFKEYVNMGSVLDFREFCLWIYKYQDRNFFDELIYSNVLKQIFEHFRMDQVKILFFEDYKLPSNELSHDLFMDLSQFLQIDYLSREIVNRNPSMQDSDIPSLLKINKTKPFDFGNHQLSGIEEHRRRKFYTTDLKMSLTEEEQFASVLKKRANHELRKQYQGENEYSYEIDEFIFAELKAAFRNDWSSLSRILKSDIYNKLIMHAMETTSNWQII